MILEVNHLPALYLATAYNPSVRYYSLVARVPAGPPGTVTPYGTVSSSTVGDRTLTRPGGAAEPRGPVGAAAYGPSMSHFTCE